MAWYTVYILPNNNYIVQELDEGITKEQVDTVNDTLHKISNVEVRISTESISVFLLRSTRTL